MTLKLGIPVLRQENDQLIATDDAGKRAGERAGAIPAVAPSVSTGAARRARVKGRLPASSKSGINILGGV